jgi:fluoroacetyl-CoA thioesterase
MLDAGHDTVGTHVNVSHLAAAPMGATVVFASELLAVNKRRVEFRVSARLGDRSHRRRHPPAGDRRSAPVRRHG